MKQAKVWGRTGGEDLLGTGYLMKVKSDRRRRCDSGYRNPSLFLKSVGPSCLSQGIRLERKDEVCLVR